MSNQERNTSLDLEMELRRYAAMVAARGGRKATESLSAALTSATNEAIGAVTDHDTKRQFVHGVGPHYLAKSSRPDQWPDWKDLRGTPPDLSSRIDPATLELDADQIVSGTIPEARLPIAEPGEASPALVRGNDPRLTGGGMSIVRPTSESLAAGDWVNIHVVGGVNYARKAIATHPNGAIGFVAQSVGSGEQAIIFLAGENAWVQLPGVTSADVGKTVFLGSTAGRCGLTPPGTVGTVIQPLGTIIKAADPVATVLVRFELRFQL